MSLACDPRMGYRSKLSFTLLALCAVPAPTRADEPGTAVRSGPSSRPPKLLPLPDVRQQTNYTCGAAALKAVLAYYGKNHLNEMALSRQLRTTPKDGTDPADIRRVAQKYGVEAQIKTGLSLRDLERSYRSGRPVIVAYQAWPEHPKQVDYKNDWVDGHYSVVIGLDEKNVYLEDPSLRGARGSIARSAFLERWHDTDRYERRLNRLGIVFSGDAK